MPIDKYLEHPALRPTMLARDVLENVYRPSGEMAAPTRPSRPDATKALIARGTPRAA